MSHTLPIKNGIQAAGSLQVKLQDGRAGWYPQVSTGFFSYGAQDRYLFASPSTETLPYSVGLTSHTYSGTLDLRNASKQGPIFLRDTFGQFVRATNCLRCFVAYTPAGASELMTVTLPAGSSLELATLKTGEHLRQAYVVQALYQDPKTYMWNESTGVLSIGRATTDPNRTDPLYLTYRLPTPGLMFSEIRMVDSDGYLRVSLGGVANFTSYEPTLSLPASGTIAVTSVSGNVLVPASTIAVGTQVAVNYYVDRSFSLGFSGTNQVISVLSSASGSAELEFEAGSIDSYRDLGDTSWAEKVSLNPRSSGFGGGYLYIGSTRPSGENLYRVIVRATPDYVIGRFSQPSQIVITTEDTEGAPIPDVDFTISISDGVTTHTPAYKSLTTDRKGQGFAKWFPTGDLDPGVYTISVTATSAAGVAVSGTDELVLADPLVLTAVANDPKVHLHLSKSVDSQGLRDLFVYVVDQSGIPYLGDYTVRVTCELGKLLHNVEVSTTSLIGGYSITLNPNDTADVRGAFLLSCKYAPIAGDILMAHIQPVPTSTSIYSFNSTPLEVTYV